MINLADLYSEEYDNLVLYSHRFTSDTEMIKDCIQDVFLKLFLRGEKLEKIENLKVYIYISLRNRISDEFRRNAHYHDEEINDLTMDCGDVDPETIIERREKAEREKTAVSLSLSALSPRQRQIIHLYYDDGYKYDDICRIIGINYQSVRNLMHRSISRLREVAV